MNIDELKRKAMELADTDIDPEVSIVLLTLVSKINDLIIAMNKSQIEFGKKAIMLKPNDKDPYTHGMVIAYLDSFKTINHQKEMLEIKDD